MLNSPSTLIFILFSLLCIVFCAIMLNYVLGILRLFEDDVDIYQRVNTIEDEGLILPPRESKSVQEKRDDVRQDDRGQGEKVDAL